MLIDDSEIDNMVNKHILSKNNIAEHILVFSSAHDALEYFNANNELLPNIILLDINMPIMNGFGFLVEFEKMDSKIVDSISVVMLTSSVDPNDIRRSKEFRTVKSFISKPLSLEHLEKI